MRNSFGISSQRFSVPIADGLTDFEEIKNENKFTQTQSEFYIILHNIPYARNLL